jgi:hypothetical protein
MAERKVRGESDWRLIPALDEVCGVVGREVRVGRLSAEEAQLIVGFVVLAKVDDLSWIPRASFYRRQRNIRRLGVRIAISYRGSV